MYTEGMNMERMPHREPPKEFPIDHGKIQARVAEWAFKTEHPGVSVGRNEIMMDWVREHAADWRKVIDAHVGEMVAIDDEATLERFYKEMLERHGDSDATVH